MLIRRIPVSAAVVDALEERGHPALDAWKARRRRQDLSPTDHLEEHQGVDDFRDGGGVRDGYGPFDADFCGFDCLGMGTGFRDGFGPHLTLDVDQVVDPGGGVEPGLGGTYSFDHAGMGDGYGADYSFEIAFGPGSWGSGEDDGLADMQANGTGGGPWD